MTEPIPAPRTTRGHSSKSGAHPNLLLIVMDCVRAQEFSAGSAVLDQMPFCSKLARESIQFQRTVAPASWTIPSHASLFTGLYAWDHGLHSRGVARLPRELPHLASSLGRAGYRTGSFSSNPFVSDDTGLTEAFQTAQWGGWWERYARHIDLGRPPAGRALENATPTGLARVRGGRLWPMTLSASRWVLRHPTLLHAGNRVLRSLRGGPSECSACVSPWIERSVERWIGRQSAQEPVFVFVNLMEGHEPYMLPDHLPMGSSRWRALTVRQDFGDWLEGRWSPSSDETKVLRELYAASIRALDHRIRGLVEIFRKAGRWDSTTLVLTSDHGQALGENGLLSHGMSVSDQITDIPLWLRSADGFHAGSATSSWASLVDVAPTFEAIAGVTPTTARPGIDLRTLVDAPRPSPAWSMAEGLIWPGARAHIDPERLKRFDRVRIAGYLGNTKISSDGSGEIVSVHPLPGMQGRPTENERAMAEVVVSMREHLIRLDSIGPATQDSSTEMLRRMEAWGYA